ncbi:MAG: transglutaminase family protein [Verrucomicrobiales bacterium]|jgi:transglutaminase-like putative cysteine protease|nr:transglutaminase family protein [Verrucomicrobiales bacterium]
MSEEYRYRVRHRTAYDYTGRIDLCHSVAHLRPREEGDQEVLSHRVDVSPEPHFQVDREDYYDNGTLYFEIQGSHEHLEVVSSLTLVKTVKEIVDPRSGVAWDDLAQRAKPSDAEESGLYLANFLLPSRACPREPAIDAFLQPSLAPGKDSMELVEELMSRVYTEFEYDPGATDTSTPIQEVLEKKRGVCQDFAHVMIVALRRIGIPVRYVSGYLETLPPPGQEKLQGADATHAWVEAYSKANGWVGFDPTNDRIPAHQHIKIAHGRDYFDVQPLRGMFIGNSSQKLVVEVDVERI